MKGKIKIKYFMTTDRRRGSDLFTEELIHKRDIEDISVVQEFAEKLVQKRREYEDVILVSLRQEKVTEKIIQFQRI